MLSFALSIVCIAIAQGFLLDSNSSKTSVGNVLTMSEYYADKKELQHRFDELQHKFAEERLETDKTLALLTNQIQQKFTTMQDVCTQKSTTVKLDKLKESFIQLQGNHSRLQNNYDKLLLKSMEQERKLDQIDNKTDTVNITDNLLIKALENKTLEVTKAVNSDNILIKTLENKTSEVVSAIKSLEQLKSVQNLKDIQAFQTQIQILKSETNTLKLKEQARTQDILALYNATKSFETFTNDQFRKLQQEQNTSTTLLEQHIEGTDMQVNVLDRRTNLTQRKMEHELMQIQETVLLRSCISKNTRFSNTIIKLDSVKEHTGIVNITHFTSTGKFTCEKPGLYFISASITSSSVGPTFSIRKNSDIIFTSYLSNSGHVEGVTGDVVTELHIGDTVWLNAENDFYLYYLSSCLMIAKIR